MKKKKLSKGQERTQKALVCTEIVQDVISKSLCQRNVVDMETLWGCGVLLIHMCADVGGITDLEVAERIRKSMADIRAGQTTVERPQW